ncbi:MULTISPECIES: RidA family protein [Spongiibacter]|uniref:RidA family protein n=1 Tax=Spongiibacter TaxID=630749 RepID=UPI000C4CF066|nr:MULTISPECIES: RidA family protein [Spongiibacter]MAY39382.1 reactive intermediate/imine deaminase [Spongiibacter sp.]MBO6754117.1 RidA family protein [Spongiibacter sp.]MBU73561.1 reactive intermediate/imine deaminase [Spongiibacter sp.]
MNVIHTELAPQAIGPYSQAIAVNGLVFVSGQIPLDPVSGELREADIHIQTTQVFENLKAVLDAAGSDFSKIVKLSIFMVDLADFAIVNSIMSEYFTEPYPARACVQVAALPKGAMVEVEAVAISA